LPCRSGNLRAATRMATELTNVRICVLNEGVA
jgi:hypothetical protein